MKVIYKILIATSSAMILASNIVKAMVKRAVEYIRNFKASK